MPVLLLSLLTLLESKDLNEAVKSDTYDHDCLRRCTNVRQVIGNSDRAFW